MGRLAIGRVAGNAVCARTAARSFSLRMGYLDDIEPKSQNMKGLDENGKPVMPSFEEFMQVPATALRPCLDDSLPLCRYPLSLPLPPAEAEPNRTK